MRPRVVLVLTWLLAVVAATGVAFAATGLVGDVLRGQGPIGAEVELGPGPAAGPTASNAGPPVAGTFRPRAGSLVATCRGATVTLDRVRGRGGWRLESAERGPDEDVDATLRRAGRTFVVEIYCNEGTPVAVLGNGG